MLMFNFQIFAADNEKMRCILHDTQQYITVYTMMRYGILVYTGITVSHPGGTVAGFQMHSGWHDLGLTIMTQGSNPGHEHQDLEHFPSNQIRHLLL